jgi:hypothetical protein
MPRGGVNDQTGRLIEREDIGVFIQDLERDRFSREGGWLGRRDGQSDPLAGEDGGAGLQTATFDQYPPGIDQTLDLRSRQAGDPRQVAIEALVRSGAVGHELADLLVAHLPDR